MSVAAYDDDLYYELSARATDREFCSAAIRAGPDKCRAAARATYATYDDLPDGYDDKYSSPISAAVSIGVTSRRFGNNSNVRSICATLLSVLQDSPDYRLAIDDHAYLRLCGMTMSGLIAGDAVGTNELNKALDVANLHTGMSALHAHRNVDVCMGVADEIAAKWPRHMSYRRARGLESAVRNAQRENYGSNVYEKLNMSVHGGVFGADAEDVMVDDSNLLAIYEWGLLSDDSDLEDAREDFVARYSDGCRPSSPFDSSGMTEAAANARGLGYRRCQVAVLSYSGLMVLKHTMSKTLFLLDGAGLSRWLDCAVAVVGAVEGAHVWGVEYGMPTEDSKTLMASAARKMSSMLMADINTARRAARWMHMGIATWFEEHGEEYCEKQTGVPTGWKERRDFNLAEEKENMPGFTPMSELCRGKTAMCVWMAIKLYHAVPCCDADVPEMRRAWEKKLGTSDAHDPAAFRTYMAERDAWIAYNTFMSMDVSKRHTCKFEVADSTVYDPKTRPWYLAGIAGHRRPYTDFDVGFLRLCRHFRESEAMRTYHTKAKNAVRVGISGHQMPDAAAGKLKEERDELLWVTKHGDRLSNGKTLSEARDEISSGRVRAAVKNEMTNKAENTKYFQEVMFAGFVDVFSDSFPTAVLERLPDTCRRCLGGKSYAGAEQASQGARLLPAHLKYSVVSDIEDLLPILLPVCESMSNIRETHSADEEFRPQTAEVNGNFRQVMTVCVGPMLSKSAPTYEKRINDGMRRCRLTNPVPHICASGDAVALSPGRNLKLLCDGMERAAAWFDGDFMSAYPKYLPKMDVYTKALARFYKMRMADGHINGYLGFYDSCDMSTIMSTYVNIGKRRGNLPKSVSAYVTAIIDDFAKVWALLAGWDVAVMTRIFKVVWPGLVAYIGRIGPKIHRGKSTVSYFKGQFVNRFWSYGIEWCRFTQNWMKVSPAAEFTVEDFDDDLAAIAAGSWSVLYGGGGPMTSGFVAAVHMTMYLFKCVRGSRDVSPERIVAWLMHGPSCRGANLPVLACWGCSDFANPQMANLQAIDAGRDSNWQNNRLREVALHFVERLLAPPRIMGILSLLKNHDLYQMSTTSGAHAVMKKKIRPIVAEATCGSFDNFVVYQQGLEDMVIQICAAGPVDGPRFRSRLLADVTEIVESRVEKDIGQRRAMEMLSRHEQLSVTRRCRVRNKKAKAEHLAIMLRAVSQEAVDYVDGLGQYRNANGDPMPCWAFLHGRLLAMYGAQDYAVEVVNNVLPDPMTLVCPEDAWQDNEAQPVQADAWIVATHRFPHVEPVPFEVTNMLTAYIQGALAHAESNASPLVKLDEIKGMTGPFANGLVKLLAVINGSASCGDVLPRLDVYQIKGYTDVDPVALTQSVRITLAHNPQRWPGGRCGGSHTRALGRPWGHIVVMHNRMIWRIVGARGCVNDPHSVTLAIRCAELMTTPTLCRFPGLDWQQFYHCRWGMREGLRHILPYEHCPSSDAHCTNPPDLPPVGSVTAIEAHMALSAVSELIAEHVLMPEEVAEMEDDAASVGTSVSARYVAEESADVVLARNMVPARMTYGRPVANDMDWSLSLRCPPDVQKRDDLAKTLSSAGASSRLKTKVSAAREWRASVDPILDFCSVMSRSKVLTSGMWRNALDFVSGVTDDCPFFVDPSKVADICLECGLTGEDARKAINMSLGLRMAPFVDVHAGCREAYNSVDQQRYMVSKVLDRLSASGLAPYGRTKVTVSVPQAATEGEILTAVCESMGKYVEGLKKDISMSSDGTPEGVAASMAKTMVLNLSRITPNAELDVSQVTEMINRCLQTDGNRPIDMPSVIANASMADASVAAHKNVIRHALAKKGLLSVPNRGNSTEQGLTMLNQLVWLLQDMAGVGFEVRRAVPANLSEPIMPQYDPNVQVMSEAFARIEQTAAMAATYVPLQMRRFVLDNALSITDCLESVLDDEEIETVIMANSTADVPENVWSKLVPKYGSLVALRSEIVEMSGAAAVPDIVA